MSFLPDSQLLLLLPEMRNGEPMCNLPSPVSLILLIIQVIKIKIWDKKFTTTNKHYTDDISLAASSSVQAASLIYFKSYCSQESKSIWSKPVKLHLYSPEVTASEAVYEEWALFSYLSHCFNTIQRKSVATSRNQYFIYNLAY